VKEHDTKSPAACQQFFVKDQPCFAVGKQSGRQAVWTQGSFATNEQDKRGFFNRETREPTNPGPFSFVWPVKCLLTW
jgi:hypothetical protein